MANCFSNRAHNHVSCCNFTTLHHFHRSPQQCGLPPNLSTDATDNTTSSLLDSIFTFSRPITSISPEVVWICIHVHFVTSSCRPRSRSVVIGVIFFINAAGYLRWELARARARNLLWPLRAQPTHEPILAGTSRYTFRWSKYNSN
eukprot:SAG31_NODE_2074_length_6511_cov_11.947754_2_plen_145_part_00